jgi:hypothetical protein
MPGLRRGKRAAPARPGAVSAGPGTQSWTERLLAAAAAEQEDEPLQVATQLAEAVGGVADELFSPADLAMTALTGLSVYQVNPTYPPLVWKPPLLIAVSRGARATCASGLNLSPVRMPTSLSFPRGISTMSRLPEGLDQTTA